MRRTPYRGPRLLPGQIRPRLRYPQPRVEPEPEPTPAPEPMVDPRDPRYVTMGGEWCMLPHNSKGT
jgi:hypothetical protein